jgi:hypothetical protein
VKAAGGNFGRRTAMILLFSVLDWRNWRSNRKRAEREKLRQHIISVRNAFDHLIPDDRTAR